MSKWYSDERSGAALDPGNLLGYRQGGIHWGGILDPGGSMAYGWTGKKTMAIKTRGRYDKELEPEEKPEPEMYKRKPTGPQETILTGTQKDKYKSLREKRKRSGSILAAQSDEPADMESGEFGTKELKNF